MKVRLSISFFLLSAVCAHARQTSASQPQAPPTTVAQSEASKIDPVKAADIQKLMDVMGMKDVMTTTMNQMLASIKPTMSQMLPPGDYRDTLLNLFLQRLQSKLNVQQFLDQAEAAYDKYYSDDDIKGLIQFYQTPLGKKMLAVLPSLTVEVTNNGRALGQEAGRDAMLEVLAEHPDIAKQLQDASSSSQGSR